jgi:hypothetical protein
MARKVMCPTVPYASVGDTVQADNGQMYVIMWVDGARVRLKHLGEDGKAGRGRPSNGFMVGDPSQTIVDTKGEVEMAGPVEVTPAIDIPIYVVSK